ncbi:hypothetical protein Y032_0040g185 [Ancylostoma ceylanicum]|uniref:Uncharacterized protein n=1 Tax=Ancylostoma ceylanicum TaxID=53326 RepID=A0A016UII0_9BILA|nr:hypothetical protein Y032_0040g185 [Ancylostoma ceylanicum]
MVSALGYQVFSRISPRCTENRASPRQCSVLLHFAFQHSLVIDCWNEKPNDRPSSERICSQLSGMMNASKKANLMDHLFAMLEMHTEELERKVSCYVVRNWHRCWTPRD